MKVKCLSKQTLTPRISIATILAHTHTPHINNESQHLAKATIQNKIIFGKLSKGRPCQSPENNQSTSTSPSCRRKAALRGLWKNRVVFTATALCIWAALCLSDLCDVSLPPEAALPADYSRVFHESAGRHQPGKQRAIYRSRRAM